MLLPGLMKTDKIQRSGADEIGEVCHAVGGNDFLIITGVYGAPILGRILAYSIRDKITLKKTTLGTFCTTFCVFVAMLVWRSLIVSEIALGVVVFVSGIENVIIYMMQYDASYFGDFMNLSSMILVSTGLAGTIISNAITEFTTNMITIVCCIILSVITSCVACLGM